MKDLHYFKIKVKKVEKISLDIFLKVLSNVNIIQKISLGEGFPSIGNILDV